MTSACHSSLLDVHFLTFVSCELFCHISVVSFDACCNSRTDMYDERRTKSCQRNCSPSNAQSQSRILCFCCCCCSTSSSVLLHLSCVPSADTEFLFSSYFSSSNFIVAYNEINKDCRLCALFTIKKTRPRVRVSFFRSFFLLDEELHYYFFVSSVNFFSSFALLG